MKAWALLQVAALSLGCLACSAERAAEGRGQCPDGGMPGGDQCSAGACPRLQEGGAVVVRWRVVDGLSGRLFSRSQCCCTAASDDLPPAARDTCVAAGGEISGNCPAGASWYIPQIQLEARRLDNNASFTFCERCSNAELTTEFCLSEGEYLLQVRAALWRPASDKSCWGYRELAVAPSGVRRVVKPGQIVNLDVVVLQVNGAPLTVPPDLQGGAADGAVGDAAAGGG